MGTSATAIHFNDVTTWLELNDGCTVWGPAGLVPQLLHATAEQREQCRISVTGAGLHWEELDEDGFYTNRPTFCLACDLVRRGGWD